MGDRLSNVNYRFKNLILEIIATIPATRKQKRLLISLCMTKLVDLTSFGGRQPGDGRQGIPFVDVDQMHTAG